MSKKLGEPVALARAEDGHTVIGPGAFAVMTDFAWLERANRNARKGKRYREEVRYFHQNLDGNLLDIQQVVRAGTYRTGGDLPHGRLPAFVGAGAEETACDGAAIP